jgi:hypothetical protein
MEEEVARAVMTSLQAKTEDAKDNLTKAKVQQEWYANQSRNKDEKYEAGDKVMLSTFNRRREYVHAGNKEKWVAKFLPRFDGPYTITDVFPQFSTYRLDMPNQPNTFNMFHASQLKRHHENDCSLFPSRELGRPGPVLTSEGMEEYAIEKIIDERRRRRGMQYLVCWAGYGPEDDRWLPGRELNDCEVLDRWMERKGGPCTQ